MDFMKTMGLRPCFKAWITNGSMVRKNPKGELAALRLEFYCTAQSVADLEYWNRQARQLRNGKKTGVWRKGDLQLDFRYGIMDLVDLQGRIWTASEWDLLRNGVEAENGKVSSITTMIMVVVCQVLNSNMADRRSRLVKLEYLWSLEGLLGD